MHSPLTSPFPDTAGPAGGGETLNARSFQHYKVLRRADGTPWELGRGTMGITYKALDTNLRSEVALKVVNSTLIDRPSARERFVREARAAAALRHRNVASVYHLGNDGEHFFYAMEFIDGETLDALVRRQGPLPVGTALRLTLQAARALAAAARQNLVHRDIKPANLMVVHEDADEHMVIKVIDFGLARPTATNGDGEEIGAGSLTVHGFVGTPQYASPEQLEESVLDARSDIYSLGVTLWFLLTGKPPFAGSLAGICNQQLSKPPPWETLPASVPEPARKLLAHMLEKDAARRPQDAVELRREIDECLAALHTPAPAAAAEDGLQAGPAPGPFAKLFTGRGRVLSAAPGTSAAPIVLPLSPAPASVAVPEIGLILDRRFELTRLAGEGGSGRVFEARDLTDADGDSIVAVKLLRAGMGGNSPDEAERLRADARRVSAAPHPHLVRMLAFEPGAAVTETPGYLAEEWLSGFTLRDFLAARNGALPAAECLRLLGQAAKAADHAASRHLERLELGIHQIHLHFSRNEPGRPTPDRRAFLHMSMEEWPEWALKIEAFGLTRDGGELGTWSGDLTLLPGTPIAAAARQGHNATANSAHFVSASYLHALARITCELLGGQPPSTRGLDGRAIPARYVSLPYLNEAGNAVLARALSDAPGFESARKFYETLVTASGFEVETLAPVAPRSLDPFPPKALPTTLPVPVPAPRSTDSSAAQTRLQSAGTFAVGKSSGAGTRTDGTASTVRSPATDFGGWEDPAPVRRRVAEFSAKDPWEASQLAKLLEDEEVRKLIDPRSTGFALGVGGMIGLVLLMAGFAVVAWRHQYPPSGAVQKPSYPTAKSKNGTDSHPAAQGSPPPAPLVAPLATPPPLVRQQPPPPAARTPAPVAQRSPYPVPKAAPPRPEPVTRVNSPAIAAASSPPSLTTPPAAILDAAPAASQKIQPFLTAEEARQRPEPTPRIRDKMIGVQLNSDPEGAELFLDGASLGRTPLSISLPPGDYQFIARYRNWPEIRQDLHLSDQPSASADIHLMSPARVPSNERSSGEPGNRRRQNRRDRFAAQEAEDIPVAPAAPADAVPVARAKPVVPPPGDGAVDRGPSPGNNVPARRAWPALEPFFPHENGGQDAAPQQTN